MCCQPLGMGREIVERVRVWASVILSHSSKHSASAISPRFSLRPWYYSDRTSPFIPKRGSPTVIFMFKQRFCVIFNFKIIPFKVENNTALLNLKNVYE